jgi:hypothetical protein
MRHADAIDAGNDLLRPQLPRTLRLISTMGLRKQAFIVSISIQGGL